MFVSKNFAVDQVDKQKPSFREWFQIGYVVVLQQNDQGAGDDQVVTQKGKQRKAKNNLKSISLWKIHWIGKCRERNNKYMSVSKQDLGELTKYLKKCWTTASEIDSNTIKLYQMKQNLGHAIYTNTSNQNQKCVGWEFPSKLTSYHRREIHTLADDMNITHCSKGDARQHTRHIALYASPAIMKQLNGGAPQQNQSKGKKGKQQHGENDDEVQRAVQNALRKAAELKKQQHLDRNPNGKTDNATRQQLVDVKKKTIAGLRASVKSMRHLKGEEAEATRVMYIQMVQRLSGETVETTTEEDEALSEDSEEITKDNDIKITLAKSNSDTSSSSSEESDDDESDDDLSMIARKRPTGFAFSDSDSDSDDVSDEEEEEEEKEKEKVQPVPVVKTQKKTKKKKNSTKEQIAFDESQFLKEAAQLAKAEAESQKQNLSTTITTEKNVKNAKKTKKEDTFKLPPKKSERLASSDSSMYTQFKDASNVKIPKISEEDARRLAIMAAVAAARVEKQAANVDDKVRKATIDDILGVGYTPTYLNQAEDGPKVTGFRKQMEHGAKKFIKP